MRISPSAAARPKPGQAGGETSGGGTAEPRGPEQFTVPVIIDGFPRGTIVVTKGMTDGEMRRMVTADPGMAAFLRGKQMRTMYTEIAGVGAYNIRTNSPTATPDEVQKLMALRRQVADNMYFYNDKVLRGDASAREDVDRFAAELKKIETRLQRLGVKL